MIAPQNYREQGPQTSQLVHQHMHIVRRLAWHFHGRVGRFMEIEDLMQAGYLGLIEASQRYSVREGVSFGAYATIRVRGAILDSMRRNSNLCRKTVVMRQNVARARAKLAQDLGREPELGEVATALDIKIEELQEWERRFQVNELQSLDEVYSDHSLVFGDDAAGPEQALEVSELKAALRSAIGELPERHALVLQLYYVEELNVYEVAAVLEVTTGRVSQLKKAAILKLRDIMTEKMAA